MPTSCLPPKVTTCDRRNEGIKWMARASGSRPMVYPRFYSRFVSSRGSKDLGGGDDTVAPAVNKCTGLDR